MNIWQTAEAISWSKAFGYDEYLRVHHTMNSTCGAACEPLSEESYRAICNFFDEDAKRFFQESESWYYEEIPSSEWLH